MLYTDRITIMNIMDETYGVGKWQTSHKTRTKGDGSTEMFCEVKVFNEEIGQWLSRDDAGLGMNDKTQSTDAFKRACVLWGSWNGTLLSAGRENHHRCLSPSSGFLREAH